MPVAYKNGTAIIIKIVPIRPSPDSAWYTPQLQYHSRPTLFQCHQGASASAGAPFYGASWHRGYSSESCGVVAFATLAPRGLVGLNSPKEPRCRRVPGLLNEKPGDAVGPAAGRLSAGSVLIATAERVANLGSRH